MSLWQSIQNLLQHSPQIIHKIQSLYGEHFPIEIRYVLASWIEEKLLVTTGNNNGSQTPTSPQTPGNSLLDTQLTELDPDNPSHEPYIKQFLTELLLQLDLKIQQIKQDEDPYFLKIKLLQAASNLKQLYLNDSFKLVKFLKYALGIELDFVKQELAQGGGLGGQGMGVGLGSHGNSSQGQGSGNFGGAMSNICGASANSGNFGNIGNQGQQGNQSAAISQRNLEMEQINQALAEIKRKTLETGELVRRLEGEQEAFALKYHERQKLEGIIHLHRLQQQQQATNQQLTPQQQQLAVNLHQQSLRLETELKHKISSLHALRTDLEQKITLTVSELTQLQIKILDNELTRWKREQQLAGNGGGLNNNLDLLQSWCEDLAEFIWINRFQLKEAERLREGLGQGMGGGQSGSGGDNNLRALQEKVTQLLSSLVTSTFIVEKQPPQVMKTNTRFVSTVRLLVGGRLNVHMTPPQVKVTIISEQQANGLLKSDGNSKSGGQGSDMTSGEILNNTGTMEYHQGTKHLSVHFRNMQLKRIKRTEKKGTESVMDEKFCLHFQCQFTVGEKELIFKIWTLSLPVVVIVHGNQEPHAWATVTWDNAFGEPGRMPFQVPERVPWFLVGEALNLKFKSMTGRMLTEDNLKFLAEKGFRSTSASTNDLLTWSQFCKDPLPDKTFTFWEWFYAIMKLTREHLRGPWVDGSILGFVGRQQAEEMLVVCNPGTFLLRFSDSELGGVTIAWVHNDQKVFSLAPFTSKDLATRSLSDRIHDIQHLHYLYPDKTKDSAFSKYYTPIPELGGGSNQAGQAKGYVKPMLVTHIPGLGEVNPTSGAGTYSNPATPASGYPNSPAPSNASTIGGPIVSSSGAGGFNNELLTFPSVDMLDVMDEVSAEYNLNDEDFDFQLESYLNEMSNSGNGNSAIGGQNSFYKRENDLEERF